MWQAQSEAKGISLTAQPISPERHASNAVRQKPRVTWFRQWNTDLDDALSRLPESDACPHKLFQLLATGSTGNRKLIALVHDKGAPVAIAALRRTQDARWVPVTHYVVPGFVLPSQPGRLLDAVASLGVTVDLGFWRSEREPPSHEAIRLLWSEPSFGMETSDDFEAYWRKTGKLYAIRGARKKCSGFSLAMNQPGAARTIIMEWGKAWGVDKGELADRITAAEYLEREGRHISLMLRDGDRQVGGANCFIHNNALVAGVYFRSREYEKQDIGTYILYLTFEVAQKLNLESVDLGGGHAYKQRFAPARGVKYETRVCGNVVRYQFDRALGKLRRTALARRTAE
ncbi:GNAT family N-acetyltransferase [Mesorhizobium sp. B2-8-9]|uniref:GNAT family N-acetyltransferase n=1 Tax=Mesorhizobium sp. B2-8-9 TaxID=2589899 RepID=UPI00112ECD1E|nr:GNAT family N-acetyltransferase [Mesorhizobium sp. B2-8-9]TPI81974.1 GNAT family N-acetyltransferase [Mesorhizobium sp. B2-8-9]